MADHATGPTTTRTPTHQVNGSVAGRQVRPVRRLPGGRAVVGGFLVALSMVGVFAAYTNAQSSPDHSYAVVTADVAAGERLSGGDLVLVPLDLPADQQRVAFSDLAQIEGSTALSSMVAGQLVQSGDVAKPTGAPQRAQISMSLDPGNALGGDPNLLGAGERVRVIATFTRGGAPVTETVSGDASVVRVFGGRDQLGSGTGLTVVLAVPPGDLEPIAGAAAAGVVSLARVTGLAEAGAS